MHHGCISSSSAEWVFFFSKIELRNCQCLKGIQTWPCDIACVFILYLFVEPGGTSAHREQLTGHYVFVEVAEQSDANIG